MKKHNRALLVAGVAITVVGMINYQCLIEKKVHILGFGLSFFCTAATCLIGYAAWKKYPAKWPAAIWLLAYTINLGLFLVVMLTDRFIYALPGTLINLMHGARDLLNTPLPLLVLYFTFSKLNPQPAGQYKQ